MFKPVKNNVDFPLLEKKWLKHWDKAGIVKKYLKKNSKSEKIFSFLDGPITANNPMGVHHAWGRTYKDLWPKFYNLLGYRQRFQNGFDCQGLWVEVEVEKELRLKSKKEIENLIPGARKASIAKFVELCKQRVYKYAAIQTEQSKRLGYFADWDHSYYTMSEENNYMIWYFLKKCFEAGWIYKGRESVPWCPRCETAISEHEILTEDYKEVEHESIYFKLRITNYELPHTFLLVWTTTPWTIPANIAVAVDEELDYSLVKTDKGNIWLAKDTIKRVIKSKAHKIIKTVKGKELVGLKYESPFDDLPAVAKVEEENPKKFHTVIATDDRILPISTKEGTGLVHTAVSAGTEDFRLGKKLGLPMIPVIGDDANYLPGLGFLTGKNAKIKPRLVLDYLEDKGYAFEIFNYRHRYPACWRCKTELVWKVEDEWYIAMDKPSLRIEDRGLKLEKKKNLSSTFNLRSSGLTLRERMIEVAKTIKWMPEFGLERELDWLKNMHDWLISKKNRYWGLALPIFECGKCGNFEVIGSKEELRNRAISGWEKFKGHSPHKPYIDEVVISCSKCKARVKRVDDVGNPWLDAGIVGYSTITSDNQGEPLYFKDKSEWKRWFPADFITESFPGQFKNWFYALIAESTVLEDTTQFKTVLGFGTLLGEDGRPMHKSWGNAIEFNEGAEKIGADVMRWMYARQNPSENMLFGYKKADEVRRQFYLLLWNVYKFFVEYANLDSWSYGRHSGKRVKRASPESNNDSGVPRLDVGVPRMTNVLDKWIISKFSQLVLSVEKKLKSYNAKDAAWEVEKFVSDLSTWYIRRSRNRVWVNSEDKDDKLSFYQTLYYLLVNLTVVLSPFMPYITEEIYTNLTGRESVHLARWPKVDRFWTSQNDIIKNMGVARKVVEAGHAKRKTQGVKLRIPLARLEVEVEEEVTNLKNEIWDIVLEELNIKNIIVNKKIRYPKKPVKVSQQQLKQEGELRELLRQIQSKRKDLELKPTEFIRLTIPSKFSREQKLIQKKVLAKKIILGDSLKVEVS